MNINVISLIILCLFITKTDIALSSSPHSTSFPPAADGISSFQQLPVTDEEHHRMYLIRNGESTANKYTLIGGQKVRTVSGKSLTIPLTEEGKEQAHLVAQELAKRFPKDVKLLLVSSPAERTKQTAEVLYHEMSKTHTDILWSPDLYEGLNERGLGQWEGLPRDDKYKAASAAWHQLSAAEKFYSPEVSDGESCHVVALRALKDLEELYTRYPEYTVLAVTSYNTINAAAIQLTGAQNQFSTESGTPLPKMRLNNGDLALFEREENLGIFNIRPIAVIPIASKF